MAMPETASSRESRRLRELREEAAAPTLIGQLTGLRQEWGEGFDEDIGRPLARVLQTIRKQFKAATQEAQDEIGHLHDQLHEKECAIEENAVAAEELRELREDLEDVPRGVLTVEEVLGRHGVAA